MIQSNLHGKVALISGASRGIGEAIAHTFAAAGARVVLSSRNQENVAAVVRAIAATGGEALALACHSGDRDQVQAMVAQALEQFGRIDIAVNNAATSPHFGPLLSASEEQWDKALQVNLKGYAWLAQAVAPQMQARGSGKIINIASIAGLTPGSNMGLYSISKAGVIMLTKVLAQELGPQGIQVNAIAPGVIRTRFSSVLWNDEGRAAEIRRHAGRIGTVDDVAGAALFLASAAADYANGSVLVLDGGLQVMSTL